MQTHPTQPPRAYPWYCEIDSRHEHSTEWEAEHCGQSYHQGYMEGFQQGYNLGYDDGLISADDEPPAQACGLHRHPVPSEEGRT
jgi:hypothetical protein